MEHKPKNELITEAVDDFCVSCEEQKETHELCIQCAIELGRQNPQWISVDKQLPEITKGILGDSSKAVLAYRCHPVGQVGIEEKSFEQFLKEEIRVDRLTPIQFSGILRAHAKYEIQSEQLRKHVVVRGGDSENQFVQHVNKYFKVAYLDKTPNTPTEPLPAEGLAKNGSGATL